MFDADTKTKLVSPGANKYFLSILLRPKHLSNNLLRRAMGEHNNLNSLYLAATAGHNLPLQRKEGYAFIRAAIRQLTSYLAVMA